MKENRKREKGTEKQQKQASNSTHIPDKKLGGPNKPAE
ncbi:spore protein [Alkalicoccobacillus murimartini]|uniref:Spore protein n=1 Tax=Alkalicoccobacillus murimartini TaxID=171685 RepID=A0ABT9YDQ4_9BACI|nr:spore protein [Alkalicoccobacillus murimartini]MDQ0205967.1 hypothetical protein [Alkalicoccobacillus murimartini]